MARSGFWLGIPGVLRRIRLGATPGGAAAFGAVVAVGLAVEYAIRSRIGARIGVEMYGVLYAAFTAAGIAAKLAQLGVAGGLRRFIPLSEERGDVPQLAAWVRGALALPLALGVLLAVLATIHAAAIAATILGGPEHADVVRLAAWAIPAIVAAELAQSILFAFKRPGLALIATPLGEKGVTVAGITLVIALWPTAESAAAALAGGFLASALIGLLCVRAGGVDPWTPGASGTRALARLLTFCWPLQILAVVAPLVERLDSVLLGAFVPPRELALYHVAAPMADLVKLGLYASQMVLVAPLLAMAAGAEPRRFVEAFERIQVWTAASAGLALALLFSLATPALVVLFGEPFVGAVPAARILALGSFASAAAGPCAMALIALERPASWMWANFAAFGTLLAIDVTLVPHLGMIGVCVGRVGCLLVLSAIGLRAIAKATTRPRIFARTARVVAAATIAAGAGALACATLDESGSLVQLVAGAPLVVATYAVLVLALRVVLTERRRPA